MGEIKQTNFRINSDTADQFRTFCEERGYNQAKGFDYLMEVLQTQHTKEYVPERRIEVEEFEIASRKLLSIYLQSVEFSKDTEERVRADFETALQKKDNRIAQLESEVELHKQSVKEAEEKARNAEESRGQAEKERAQAVLLQIAAEKTAEDKVAMYEMSQKQLMDALEQLKDYPAMKAANDAYEKKLEKMENEKEEAKKEAKRNEEREVEKARKEKEQRIQELEIYVSKVLGTNDELQKQLEKLETKNDNLQEKIAELKAQIAKLKAEKNIGQNR